MSTTAGAGGLRGSQVHPHLRAGPGRLRHRLLWAFAGAFAVILGMGALGAVVGGPGPPRLCRPYHACGPRRVVRPLVNETVWQSRQYGFRLEYPAGEATVSQQDRGSLTLQANLGNGNTGTVLVQGSSARAVSPSEAIKSQIANLSGVTQVAQDTRASDQLLGGGVGYRAGAARVYTGYFAAPQGVGAPVELASEAASNGRVTVSVTVGATAGVSGPSSYLYQLADQIINSVRWPPA